MPALKNTKHEAFVQAVFKGSSSAEAYRTHVATKECPPRSAASNGGRLIGRDDIQQRLHELKVGMAEKVTNILITKEMLIKRMLETADDAKDKGVHSAAIRGYELLGRDKGAFQDNKTVTVRSITGLTEQEILDELERLNAAHEGAAEEGAAGGARPATGREKAQKRTGRVLN